MANIKAKEAGQQRREAIIDFIEGYITKHGYPPTQEEIAAGLDVSHQTVRNHLRLLEEQGRLSIGPGPRMIRLAP